MFRGLPVAAFVLAIAMTSAQPPPVTVIARARTFMPPQVLVPAGGIVRFENHDTELHTVTAVGGAFDIQLSAGEAREIAFPTPGTVAYYCRIHGTVTSGMHGIVLVQAIDAQSDTSTTNTATTNTTTASARQTRPTPTSSRRSAFIAVVLIFIAAISAVIALSRRRRRARAASDE